MVYINSKEFLDSKILIIIILSTFLTPAFGQTGWYDEWVGMQSKEVPNVLEPGFIVEEFTNGLSFPTTMTFVGDDILILQKNNGHIRHVTSDGTLQPNPILDVKVTNLYESGLLGIISKNSFVYLFYTESTQDGEKPIANNIYKYKFINNTLQDPILIKSLPVNPDLGIHNGGVMVIGKDETVYTVIGDLHRFQGSGILHNQFGPPDDTSVIMPIEPAGPYYAIGIRNSFGLTIDPVTGNMWDTENGPSKFDEVNLVKQYFNSGWDAHTGPIKESRLGNLPVPDFFGVWKSEIQIFLASIYNKFVLSEEYEYSDPEFSWEQPIAPTALEFVESEFGEYKNWLFVGDCNHGNIYKFKLNSDREGFVFNNSSLKDLVLHVQDNNDEILFAEGFGCITDIQFKNNEMFVVSLVDGTIYKISTI